jgi:NADH:ubiquinone oxidoreductase subunit C
MFLLLTNISFSILNKSYLKNNQIFYKLYFYTLFSPYIKKLFLRKITFDVRLNTGFFYFVFYLFKKSLFFRYNQLIDIICIDFLKNPRFLVEYILLSLKYSDRLYLSLFTSELDYIPSLSRIFFNAN